MRKSAQKNLGEAEIGKFGHVLSFEMRSKPRARRFATLSRRIR
jgi:hypothetical protein